MRRTQHDLLAAVASRSRSRAAGARAGCPRTPKLTTPPGAVADPPAAPNALERVTRRSIASRTSRRRSARATASPGTTTASMMGEHWFKPELLRESVCDLERPAFLQYLMIDGRRTLIGVGYVCDAKQPPPNGFGPEAVWHRHGPELCRFRSGVFNDASYYAQLAPESAERRHLGGHLRALVGGARAPRGGDAAHLELDRAARRTLRAREPRDSVPARRGCACRAASRARHAGGPRRRSIRCGSPTATRPAATRAPSSSRISAASTPGAARRVLRRGERRGEEAVERMRAADKLGDPVTVGRRRPRRRRRARGDAQTRSPRGSIPTTREVIERFLASLVVHEPHGSSSVTHARAASAQAPEQD